MNQTLALREAVRLVVVEYGPLRNCALSILQTARLDHQVWLPSERNASSEIMQIIGCLVLPLLAAGISIVILDTIICTLLVIAIDFGGSARLVVHGITGRLVPAADAPAIAECLAEWAPASKKAAALDFVDRRFVEEKFSMQKMVQGYQAVSDQQLGSAHQRSILTAHGE